ncbi:MAG: hypothetical protein IJS62_06915 [Bacteroidales bacterium]|nr:hypothetical protein [Bacteroidales bacterium]
MKSWGPFLLCLLLSMGIWLAHNLSLTYTDQVSIGVVAESNLEGRALRSSSEVEVTARIRASGFHLIWMARPHVVTVFFRAEDLVHREGDVFTVSAADLMKYSSDIFGNASVVERFNSSELQVRFKPEYSRKVPVRASRSLSFKPQYILRGDIALEPDSVLIFGDRWRVDDIDAIYTRNIAHSDLRKSVHGTVKLEKPSGIRLSADHVSYDIELTRFVELQGEVAVQMRGVPPGVKMHLRPSTVHLHLKCIFPLSSNPVDQAVVYADYDEFLQTRSGSCILHCDNLPASVLDCRIVPQVCECIEISE